MPMLADSQDTTPQSGFLSEGVHQPATSRYALIEFITDQLPLWRDDGGRPDETGEDALTSHLCAYLNSAAYHSNLDFIQFVPQFPDEKHKGRKPDLVALPRGFPVLIESRSHTHFEPILPIECKRLPTPKGKDRDEREYVINRHASTGGIQRFKAGHHGSVHKFAAMIAYVQKETLLIWEKRVAGWIKDLAESGQPGWTEQDLLCLEKTNNKELGLSVLSSRHQRDDDLGEIELRHLWLVMI